MESVDPEMDELKELIKRQGAIIKETHEMVRKMRRNQVWHTVFNVVWWLAVLGVVGAAYYYYIQPYLEQILALYGQAQGYGDQFRDFFANFRPGQ